MKSTRVFNTWSPSCSVDGSVSIKTRQRQARRPPEERECLELARHLDRLSFQFPRFRSHLNRVAVHARAQLKTDAIKRRDIRRALSTWRILTFNELSEEVSLDEANLVRTLEPMMQREVVTCFRDGDVYQPNGQRHDPLGRPIDRLGRVGSAKGQRLFFRLVKDTVADG
jgi:hypothetical protein